MKLFTKCQIERFSVKFLVRIDPKRWFSHTDSSKIKSQSICIINYSRIELTTFITTEKIKKVHAWNSVMAIKSQHDKRIDFVAPILKIPTFWFIRSLSNYVAVTNLHHNGTSKFELSSTFRCLHDRQRCLLTSFKLILFMNIANLDTQATERKKSKINQFDSCRPAQPHRKSHLGPTVIKKRPTISIS